MSISTPPIGNRNVSNSIDSEINTEKVQPEEKSKLPADSKPEVASDVASNSTLSKSGAQAKMAEHSMGFLARKAQILSSAQAIPTHAAPTTSGKKIDDQFKEATLKNDVKKMEELLKKGADINSKDSNGKTALMLAATSGNITAMETLVNKFHANVTVKDKNDQTALSQAASMGLNDSVKTLLNFRPKVTEGQDINGNTPLMNAVKNGHSNVVKTLLEKGGAAASIPDDQGRTPLMESIKRGDGRSVKELLKHNPGFDIQDENGKTALMEAIDKGNPAVIRALTKRSDPDLQNKDGDTALMLLLRKGFVGTPADPVAIGDMIGRSQNLDIQSNAGRTALMEASKSVDSDSVRALIDKGANLDLQDKKGKSAIMEVFDAPQFIAPAAFAANRDAMIKRANLDLQDIDGKTALVQAADRGDAETIRTLNAEGANLDIPDKSGRTALMSAAESGKLDAVRFLLDKDHPDAGNGTLRKADATLLDNNHITAWRLAYNHLKNVPMDNLSKEDYQKILDLLPAERYKQGNSW
jgi:ankyrin repeat protein